MKSVTIQNKKIKLMTHNCLLNNEIVPPKVEPFVDISVYLTDRCNAKCEFCCNNEKEDYIFDVDSFRNFFEEVLSKVTVNKVNFTGGEASLESKKLQDCLEIVNKKCNSTIVNTNGTLLKKKVNDDTIGRIALSRHHYLDDRNNEIFGINISNKLSLLDEQEKQKITLICNLIKGEIDSTKEMYKMLEFAAYNKIKEMAFVVLMPFNDYSKKHMIIPNPSGFNEDILHTKKMKFKKKNICECANYTYVSNSGDIVNFYIKHSINPFYNKGSRIVWKGNRIQ